MALDILFQNLLFIELGSDPAKQCWVYRWNENKSAMFNITMILFMSMNITPLIMDINFLCCNIHVVLTVYTCTLYMEIFG